MRTRLRGDDATAFSLIEVIVAIGLFGTGVVALIGLFGSLARSIGAGTEMTVAANLGDPLRNHFLAELTQSRSLDSVRALLERGDNSESIKLYASRDGLTIGAAEAAMWRDRASEQFFEITLLPLADAPNDLALLCYVADIRWPAGRGDAGGVSEAEQRRIQLPGAVGR
jgi:type II secretory pathway pseudopilin PulG